MGLYRWRIPQYKAVQFDGKNNKEIKMLLGDESESEEPTIGTGKFEEPKHEKNEKKSEPHGHGLSTSMESSIRPYKAPEPPPKEIREKLKIKSGDWVTVDPATGKVEINPEGFPEKFEFISS